MDESSTDGAEYSRKVSLGGGWQVPFGICLVYGNKDGDCVQWDRMSDRMKDGT